MKDLFGRKIEYLRLSVTDRCNLRCRYCMPEEGVPPLRHENILSYEEMLRIASLAVSLGVNKIRVTGGEPLVRKGILPFLETLSGLPGSPEVVLTTNGLRLAEMADDLAATGVRRINVSIDTLKPERFQGITRRGGLDRVLDGLQAAEGAGLNPLKINMVPIRGVNDDELIDFARLTLEHPWHVRFIEFMPVSDQLGFTADQRLPASEIKQRLRSLAPLQPLPDKTSTQGPARLFRLPAARGLVGIIPAVSEHFCGECNRLRLTADGRLRPCLFSTDEIDLAGPMRGGAGDAELKRLLLHGVATKPERHRIGEQDVSCGSRQMSGIGG